MNKIKLLRYVEMKWLIIYIVKLYDLITLYNNYILMLINRSDDNDDIMKFPHS